jgi:hypothetical protein
MTETAMAISAVQYREFVVPYNEIEGRVTGLA